jgi:hypothetical protein
MNNMKNVHLFDGGYKPSVDTKAVRRVVKSFAVRAGLAVASDGYPRIVTRKDLRKAIAHGIIPGERLPKIVIKTLIAAGMKPEIAKQQTWQSIW